MFFILGSKTSFDSEEINDHLKQIEILKLNEDIKIYQSDLEESRKTAQLLSQERDDFKKRLEKLQANKLQLENDLLKKTEVIGFIFFEFFENGTIQKNQCSNIGI
jgi:hypothetical protein